MSGLRGPLVESALHQLSDFFVLIRRAQPPAVPGFQGCGDSKADLSRRRKRAARFEGAPGKPAGKTQGRTGRPVQHPCQRSAARVLRMDEQGLGRSGNCRLSLERYAMTKPVNRMRPVHPGEVLREEFLRPLGLSVNPLAGELRVPATRIHEIVNERRGITADTAVRLARYFDTSAEVWLNLQTAYDPKTLPTLADIERRVTPRAV